MIKYTIPITVGGWGEIIERCENIRKQLPDVVDYYSMAESSMEEAFLALDSLEMEASNELNVLGMNCIQSCIAGQCLNDDYYSSSQGHCQ